MLALQIYNKHIHNLGKVFCTLSAKKDTCFGDSGGPLLAHTATSNGEVVLAGVVSWGPPGSCATTNMPTVNTDITQLKNWVATVKRKAAAATKAEEAAAVEAYVAKGTYSLPISLPDGQIRLDFARPAGDAELSIWAMPTKTLHALYGTIAVLIALAV